MNQMKIQKEEEKIEQRKNIQKMKKCPERTAGEKDKQFELEEEETKEDLNRVKHKSKEETNSKRPNEKMKNSMNQMR